MEYERRREARREGAKVREHVAEGESWPKEKGV